MHARTQREKYQVRVHAGILCYRREAAGVVLFFIAVDIYFLQPHLRDACVSLKGDRRKTFSWCMRSS